MYLEFRHLRTIRAIHEAGGLARAADMLHITQSALSHQVKALEEQVGMELFHRRTKPMKLSPAGLKLLRLAERILPEISAVEEEFRAMQSGRSGRLHIAIECHACFDWLFPVLDGLRSAWPDVDVDIRMRLAFDAIEALRREEVDFVISSDPVSLPGITFQPLFDYEPMFVCPRGHRLAEKPFIEAEDFAEETLLHYPVERAKLDIFTQLLTPARVEPRGMRPVELRARRDGAARLGLARRARPARLRGETDHRSRAFEADVCRRARGRHHPPLHRPHDPPCAHRAGEDATGIGGRNPYGFRHGIRTDSETVSAKKPLHRLGKARAPRV